MNIDVTINPPAIALLRPEALRGKVCVVFDVLRATTSIVTGLAHGADGFYPVATEREAHELRSAMPHALLGGERGGELIEGFDLANSPAEYCTAMGKTFVVTTTNGTLALLACRGADAVLAAGFINLHTTVRWLEAYGLQDVVLVCAGTGSGLAFEDALCAGAMIHELGNELRLGDEAVAVRDLYRYHARNLQSAIMSTGNGARLVDAGRAVDVEWALQFDSWPVVALAMDDAQGRMVLRKSFTA